MAAAPPALDSLLRSTFGHERFRPYQRDVCQAVGGGNDVLLVMPTGPASRFAISFLGSHATESRWLSVP